MYQTGNKGDKIQLTKESTAEPANGFGPSLCLQTLPRLHCFNQIYSNVIQLNCQSARMPYHSIIIMGSKTLHFFVKDHRSAAICYTWRTGECSLCRAKHGQNSVINNTQLFPIQVTKTFPDTLKNFHKWPCLALA